MVYDDKQRMYNKEEKMHEEMHEKQPGGKRMDERIQLPEKVEYIIHTLQNAGYEAYAVGGCVRDSILGRCPDDWDITTSARPYEVKALFRRTIDTGIQHGTVTVMLEQEGFEVTTYRIDGEYEDARHPKEVLFTGNLREDLRRRDFTINAMAYNERSGLVDIFGGRADLEAGRIRCVGNAEERFTEDALRMMRAVRFSAQLGFSVEEDTEKAIRKLAENLKHVSAERIQIELIKLVTSPHPDYLRKAYQCGITAVILPEFDVVMRMPQSGCGERACTGEHILRSMTKTKPDKVLRLAMLFHDLGKPAEYAQDWADADSADGCGERSARLAAEILARLKFDNDTKDKVVKLVRFQDYKIEETPASIRRAANKIGEELLWKLFALKRADAAAQDGFEDKEGLAGIERLEALYESILERGDCLSLKTLALSGRDLIAAGQKPGKEIGEILAWCLELVLEHPEYNTKESLFEQIERIFQESTS